MDEFNLPYFTLDEPWENVEAFEHYKTAVLLMQRYLHELIAFQMTFDSYNGRKTAKSVG